MSDFGANDDSKYTYVTKDGLEQLKTKLKYLEEVKRREVAERLKEAVSYGDLSENSEYEEAKNEQAQLERDIYILTEQLKYVKLIDEDSLHSKHKSVQMGVKVKIKGISGPQKGETFVYTVVGTTEADPFEKKISNESPLGNALMEKKVGEKVKFKAPIGILEYEIVRID